MGLCWESGVNTLMNFCTGNFSIGWGNVGFSKRTLLYGAGCLVSRCPNLHIFHNDLKVWMWVWASALI